MSSGPYSGPRMIGRYVLYGVIARGGMAAVHFGRLLGPVGFSRTVAIKRLHPQLAEDTEFVGMFLDEARLAARIQHPNVVSTLDVVAAEGELLLVMEYIQGESLSRLMTAVGKKGERIPPRIIGAIMVSLLTGLHAAHEAKNERGDALGIVHRDVSPQNVIVGADGVVRVFDFGVAKAAGRAQDTRAGMFKGKVAYAAPEQLAGAAVDRRIDIYAASVILWELVTGRRLFKAENELALFNMVREGRVDPPSKYVPDLPPALDALVMRGLAFDPDKRFQTAQDMSVALEEVLPQAFGREVKEWIHEVAPDILTQRARIIAEIETPTALLLPTNEEPATVARVSTSVPVLSEPPRRSRSPLVAVLIVAMLVAIVGVVLFFVRGSEPQAEGTKLTASKKTSTEPSATANATSSASEELEVIAPAVDAAPHPTAHLVKPTAVPASAPKPSASSSVAPPPPSVTAPPTKPTTTNCSPPFTIDSDGIRHPKPECL